MKWLWLVVMLAVPVDAKDEITLTVTPRYVVYQRPTYARAVYRIARHPENRWRVLATACDSGLFRSSQNEMDGENAAVLYDELVELEPGACRITACLFRTLVDRPNGQPICVHGDVDVVGGV